MPKERYSRCVQRKRERGCCLPCEMKKKTDPWDMCPVIPACLSPMRNPPDKPEQHLCARPPPMKVCVAGKIQKVPQPPYEWWDDDSSGGTPRKVYQMPQGTYPEPFYLPKTYFKPNCHGQQQQQPPPPQTRMSMNPEPQCCPYPVFIPVMPPGCGMC